MERFPRAGWHWLAPLLRQQAPALLALLLLSLSVSALVMLQPWLTKLLIDDGLIARDTDTLWSTALAMLAAAISASLLGGLNRYWYTAVSGRLLFHLREDVFDHLQTLSPAFHARQRTGDILTRLDGDIAEIQRFSIDSLFAAVSGIFGLIGTALLMTAISADLSLLVLAVVPLQWLYLRVMRERVQTAVRRVRERSADVSAFLVERIPAIRFIQSHGTGQRETARLHGLNRNYLDNLLRLQLNEFATSAVPSALTSGLRTVVLLVGGYRIIDGQMQVGELIAFTTYLGMLMGPVQTLLGVYMAFNRVKVNFNRVQWLREQQPSVAPAAGIDAPAGNGVEIRMESVSFRYPGSDRRVLCGVNALFAAGSRTAISGPSGAGKSTLIDLLMRHYDPDEGQILINGIDLATINPGSWRQRIAVVSQDITLFHASLLDNIRYADDSVSEQRALDACHDAGLDELVQQLPQGIHTLIGERGATLSGGERQRVAIARALLCDPDLLILDEPTASLDTDNEQQIISAIDRLFPDCTRITISHRDAPLVDADQSLVMRAGQLAMEQPA